MWKNISFVIGLAWLIYGAIFFEYPDWDVPLSFLMALSTYLTADRFILAVKARNYLRTALLSVGVWWAVDGSYWLYWSLVPTMRFCMDCVSLTPAKRKTLCHKELHLVGEA